VRLASAGRSAGEDEHWETDEARVRAVVEALQSESFGP
jgi:hypothetical protein